MWAETYDRSFEDLFDLQEEISLKIIAELRVELTKKEDTRFAVPCSGNLKAYRKYMKALDHFYRFNRQDNVVAQRLTEEAIALDPGYACAYSLLGGIHRMAVELGISNSPAQSLATAKELVEKAIDLNPALAGPYAVLSHVYRSMGQYDKSIEEAEKAIRFDPFSTVYFGLLGWSYFLSGQPEEAIRACKRAVDARPHDFGSQLCLASAYGAAGREEEAQVAGSKILKMNPKFSLDWLSQLVGRRYKRPADKDLIISSLRKAGLPDTPPLPLPDKPSIAVLAFDNLSGDPEQEYFSDGIAENIITALSKVGELFVIARNSSFIYKGKPVRVQLIGRELGVRYVLEGSVQKSGDSVRITAQLVDAQNGHHLWAERYDRELKAIFAVQDEITMKILTALSVQLTEGDFARHYETGINNLQAYLKILEGVGYWNVSKYSEAMKYFEEAVSLDPQSPVAYAWLSWTHLMNVWFGPSSTRKHSLKKAFEFAEKCRALDDTRGGCHGALCHAYLLKRDYDKAILEGKKAVKLDPNTAMWAIHYGWVLRSVGRYEDALREYQRALRLNPLDRTNALHHICTTYNMMRRHEEAIETCKKVIEQSPRFLAPFINLAVAYSELEQMDEARKAANKISEINPNFSVDSFEKALPYKNKADRDLIVSGLRKAGLK
jgi:TolB-like protein/Flp pilus assembly protein TadD